MKYVLLQKAIIADQLLEPGTEIGDGTAFPFSGTPGPHMRPLDKEAERETREAGEEEERLTEVDRVVASSPRDQTVPGFGGKRK
jgi:hypothetical protein